MPKKSKAVAEFGDFQTPPELALRVTRLLAGMGVRPASILEPSCGVGAFVAASCQTFPEAKVVGVDVNVDYLAKAALSVGSPNASFIQSSFFHHDWRSELQRLQGPLLITGNPPWVTNSELGALGSDNLPIKGNIDRLAGFDAVTGKSNFDISEWMLLQNLQWLQQKSGSLAVLCKVAVARKVLTRLWKSNVAVAQARIYLIDAKLHFNASVEACLLFLTIDGQSGQQICEVYENLDAERPLNRFGLVNGTTVANCDVYRRFEFLGGADQNHVWRSGVKHDCSKVMELRSENGALINGFGEPVDIEPDFLFPLLKSSDLTKAEGSHRNLWVLVPQKAVGEDTGKIRELAPKTWSYLSQHGALLDARTSVIYRKKPRFSVFGVGAYTFAPWKIAISGMYKSWSFRVCGPLDDKPVLFDDTVYFLGFEREAVARSVFSMLMHRDALEYLESMVFWNEKRPITAELLRRLSVEKLAAHLGRLDELEAAELVQGRLAFG
jgi:hypothetical protein